MLLYCHLQTQTLEIITTFEFLRTAVRPKLSRLQCSQSAILLEILDNILSNLVFKIITLVLFVMFSTKFVIDKLRERLACNPFEVGSLFLAFVYLSASSVPRRFRLARRHFGSGILYRDRRHVPTEM